MRAGIESLEEIQESIRSGGSVILKLEPEFSMREIEPKKPNLERVKELLGVLRNKSKREMYDAYRWDCKALLVIPIQGFIEDPKTYDRYPSVSGEKAGTVIRMGQKWRAGPLKRMAVGYSPFMDMVAGNKVEIAKSPQSMINND
jgi:hypothetical protein